MQAARSKIGLYVLFTDELVLRVAMAEQTTSSNSYSRHAAVWAALVVLALLGGALSPTTAQESTTSAAPTSNQGRQVSLSDQLTAGLKATTKGDKAFIAQVVNLVEEGKLPRKLVDGTFLWARERAARKSRSRELRPMVYFRPALVLRAKRIGVKL